MTTPDLIEKTTTQIVDHEGIASIRTTVSHGDPNRGGGEMVEYTHFKNPRDGLRIANALRDLCLEKIKETEA